MLRNDLCDSRLNFARRRDIPLPGAVSQKSEKGSARSISLRELRRGRYRRVVPHTLRYQRAFARYTLWEGQRSSRQGCVTVPAGERLWYQIAKRRARMDLPLLFAAFFRPDELAEARKLAEAIDIQQLVQRAKAGDGEAVAILYRLFSGAIYRYMAFRAPTLTDAEDLTAEVFIRMVEGLPSYQVTEVPFEAWLYRIAAVRVADFYRQLGRRPETDLTETMIDDEPLPEEQIAQQQAFEALRKALHQLSDEYQTILLLRFVERKSHEEVARILNKSMTAVKSAQHRALNQLTTLLGADQKIRHYLRGRRD